MKFGKQPKRHGRPSAKFLASRPKQNDASGKIANNGDLRIYLDDDRECPRGWILAKSPKAFFDIIADEEVRERITHISLDWHLGTGITNGEEVAKRLAAMLEDESIFAKLEFITLHSSDRKKAVAMARTLDAVIDRDRDIIVYVGNYRE